MPRPKGTRNRQRRFELRFTIEEYDFILAHAEQAALTPTEYIRCRVQGHRIVSRVEDHSVNELRRLGGLQNHFAGQIPSYRPKFNRILQSIHAGLEKTEHSLEDSLGEY